ncbi:alpha-L-fucosidase [Saccharicrinis aurantiacus]|uniref:alpha-L-fucosidase n=1 Tax=Saccharicrinis aurantiacus TaxID=1849719 RepID=UPI002492208E|nr:alpha-L-fucosidase [Saccharicrinis aurantiacus]
MILRKSLKKVYMVGVAGTLLLASCGQGTCDKKAEAETKFTPDWESLNTVNQVPEWFEDAKFGIYAHWGPVSQAFVDMKPKQHMAGWHGMMMYGKNGVPNWSTGKNNGKPTSNYLHHTELFGDPTEEEKYGYKYLIENFDPSGFDAVEWAELFEKSGAKFSGPVAMHHDNFAMWDSKATRWNSVNYGGIDVSKELKTEIEKRDMKFLASFHHAFTWMYYAPSHMYGKVDPKDYDLYTNKHTMDDKMPDAEFHEQWWAKLKEYIDVYQPDCLWFDWWLENMTEECRKEFLAYYYNKGIEWNKDVAVLFKETTFTEETAIRDYERGRPNQMKEQAWITDTSPGAWFYRSNAKFVSTNELVDILVDIVSKNGSMLLNVPPNPDGTIPQEMKDLLIGMGDWLKVNGDAIYKTRPWTIFGEGPTRLPAGGHKIERKKIVYQDTDIRFTKKSDTEMYAIIMDSPKKDIVIKTFSTDLGVVNNPIQNVSLLGSDEKLEWERNSKGLVIKAPKNLPTQHAHSFKITFEGYREADIGGEIEQNL